MASTFSASPGGVAAPVSVSEQKIPITILILKRGPCLCWAGAPFDLQLVAKVSAHGDLLLNFAFDCLNILGAHSGMLLSCSRTLVSIVDTLTSSGPTQVTLRLERVVIQDFELFVSRFCWQERPSGLSQLQRSWSTLDLVS